MSKQKNRRVWIPDICYEENVDGLTSRFPFIDVPPDRDMPNVLFICEARQTGQFEPDSEGNELPIADLRIIHYANMEVLQQNLTHETYSEIRRILELPELKENV